MALGFSVENLLPKARAGGALKMGLQRVDDDQWLDPEPDLLVRRRGFDDAPDSVQLLPQAKQAASELADMLQVKSDLRDCGKAVWEDLCLLTRDEAEGEYRLTAAALAFPTDWQLSEKLGKKITNVHAPIHGYREQLASGVNHFFDNLTPGPIFGRSNWFVVANDNLRYVPAAGTNPFAGVTPQNAGERLFVRCERQTLRRLPESGAILFTIGIYVTPLGQLSDAAAVHVARALANLSSGEHNRRAAPAYANALAAFAAQRQNKHLGEVI